MVSLPNHALASGEPLPKIWQDLLQRIYDGSVTSGDIDDTTAIHLATERVAGVVEGYGKSFDNIDYNTPDGEMLLRLEHDVYKFSAAESYTMNKQLTALLVDGDKIRSFEDWRREASKLTEEWVNNWAKAEYNTAVAGGQMASKWVGFKKNEESMPNLQYTTVGDVRVRDEHRMIDGVIRPITDPFWSTYYPPNGWNCRCSVIQLPGDDQPTEDIPACDIPKMFQINLAERQLVYPPDHPYYTGPSEKKLKKWVNKNLPDHE